MLSTFLIALREGLEASLIIGILVAYLTRSGRKDLLPWLWFGVGMALALSLGLGAFLTFTSTQLSVRGEQIFAGTTSIAAVAFVTIMVFWMKRSARDLRDELQGKIDQAIRFGKVALVSTAFLAVAREGLETALFVFSNFKTVAKDSAPLIGLIFGLLVAIALGIGIYRRSIKLNLGKFFTITGSALLIVAGGVLSHGISEFQQFGALPGASAYIWNWQGANSILTSILEGTVGIGTTLTWLQLFVWAAYLSITLRSFLALAPAKKASKLLMG